MQLYVAHFDVRYSNQTLYNYILKMFFCSVYYRVVSQPASWYLFLAKEAFIYRVAAIFRNTFKALKGLSHEIDFDNIVKN
jgi:hypothetical protein